MNSNNKPLRRSIGREYAFKFLYKHLLNEFAIEKMNLLEDPKALESALNLFDQSYFEEDSEHPDNTIDIHTKIFAREIIVGALKDEDKNLIAIKKYLTKTSLEKVEKMNLAVLLLGAYEILSSKEHSASIFINEYINIAKKYCPNDSHGFINGILDNIAKENGK